jgi:filamentous hemagglutinin family protein
MSGLLFFGQTASVLGNPTGGQVAAGSAAITSAGQTLTVNQTSHTAIINWQSFSIGSGELTKFVQPSATSAALNRVLGGNPSAIYGTLSANGQIYLINPNGILVGPGGVVNTAGFTASTRDISNQDFLSGNLHFVGDSDAGVQNLGTIDAFGGSIYLIGHTVDNQGTINAPQGTAGLAAGDDVLMTQTGAENLFVQPNANSSSTPGTLTGVHNSGKIAAASAELKAANGNMYALAINNSGTIVATTVKRQGGHIYLTSDSGTIVNSGTLDASATAPGGLGGTIVLKSATGTTIHSGRILARGGQGGAGGSVDISGAKLGFTGTVDLTAPGGTTGNLLLDPGTLDVVTGGSGTIVSGQNDSTSSTIDPTTVDNALGAANLTLNADTNITISDGLTWASTNTLTLSTNTSGSTIDINAPISAPNGGLTLSTAEATDAIMTGAAGSISVANFTLQNGFWNQNSATLPGFSANQNFSLQGGTFLRVTGGTGTVGSPYQITDVYGLQGIGSASDSLLSSNFVLANDIDATGTATWNSGLGFFPIGNAGTSNSYTGTFNGQGHIINGLVIDAPLDVELGLFNDVEGTIENVGLENVQIIGGDQVGALAVTNYGTITNVFSIGSVSGGEEIGGLVSVNNGSISNAYTSGQVSGTYGVGGLTGENVDNISNSYSTATVSTSSTAEDLGGLVGSNSGTISNSYSTGSVSSGLNSTSVGGLVGYNSGSINNTYTTSPVASGSGSSDVAGLVGNNDAYGDAISNSFWDTDTAGVTSGVGPDSNSTEGVTGATTSNLETQSYVQSHSSPSWDFTSTWTTNGDTTTPQFYDTLSGTAFTNSGVTFSADTLIDLISNGSVVTSTTTNGSGDYSFQISPSNVTGGILLTDATDKGDTFYQSDSPPVASTWIDLWGNTLRVVADSASNAALKQAAGSLGGINYAVDTSNNLTTAAGVNMNILSSYTLDGNITARGTFSTGPVADLSGTGAVILTGSSVSLAGTINNDSALTFVSTAGDIDANNATILAPSATFTAAGNLNLSEQLIELGGDVGVSVGSGEILILNGTIITAQNATLTSAGPLFLNSSTITLNGGNLTASGIGWTASTNNDLTDGIDVYNSTINAQGGNISLTGYAGYSSTDGTPSGNLIGGYGILIGNDGTDTTTIETSGTGNITLVADYAQNITSLGGSQAFNMYGTGNTIQAVSGLISITGTVSQGTFGNSTTPGYTNGVEIGGGAIVQTTGNGGSISVTGNVSGATVFDVGADGGGAGGIEIGGNSGSSSALSVTTNGSITLLGTGGTVNGTYASSLNDAGEAYGVHLDDGMHLTAGTGSTVSITGQGGSAVSNGPDVGDATGVSIGGDDEGGTIELSVANNGGLTITGTGGTTNTTNSPATTSSDVPGVEGVSIGSQTSITATGNAPVTIRGTGGTVTSGTNEVGNALGVGIGTDSTSNPGSTLVSTDTGALQITGFGGTSPNLGTGVVLYGFGGEAAQITSTAGNITLTGTGGSGYTGSGLVSGFSVPSAGVAELDDALIQTGGSGTIGITGTGGANSYGVYMLELPSGSFDSAPTSLPSIVSAGALTVNALSATGIYLNGTVTAPSATFGAETTAGNPSTITSGQFQTSDATITTTGTFTAYGAGNAQTEDTQDGVVIGQSTINSQGGNIFVTGLAGLLPNQGAQGDYAAGSGVDIYASTVETASPTQTSITSGNITLFGQGGVAPGISVQNSLTGVELTDLNGGGTGDVYTTISAVNGTISITGDVSSGTALSISNGDSAGVIGVRSVDGTTIQTTGAAGSISIIGNTSGSIADATSSASTSQKNQGVHIEDTLISAVGGSGIGITGTAGTLLTGANTTSTPSSAGIVLKTGATLMATGTAGITLMGTGGTNTDTSTALLGSAYGVAMNGSASTTGEISVTSTGGAISITGVGGPSPGSVVGVALEGDNGTTIDIASTTTGNVTITGSMPATASSANFLEGIDLYGAVTVQTVNGILYLHGTVDNGTAVANLNQDGSLDNGDGTVSGVSFGDGALAESTGNGSVTITGNTLGSTATIANVGVYLSAQAPPTGSGHNPSVTTEVTAAGGLGITITGTSDAIANSPVGADIQTPGTEGIRLDDGFTIMATGSAPITLMGTGGTDENPSTATVGESRGISAGDTYTGDNNLIQSASGAIMLTGVAGSDPREVGGISLDSDTGGTSKVASTSGNITLDGSVPNQVGTASESISGVSLSSDPTTSAYTTVITQTGSVFITGTVSSGSTVREGGVVISEGSEVEALGTSSGVTLLGDVRGSSATALTAGVILTDPGTLVSAGGGTGLQVTGYGGSLGGTTGTILSTDDGVYFQPATLGVGLFNSAEFLTTGSATTTLIGTGGANTNTDSTSSSAGVAIFNPQVTGTTILTSAGNLSLTGTAGSSSYAGDGVVIGGPSNDGAVSITSSGNTTITGTGAGTSPVGVIVGPFNGGTVPPSINTGTGTLTIDSTVGDIDYDATALTAANVSFDSAGNINIASALGLTGTLNVSADGTILDPAAVNVADFLLTGGTWTQIVGQNGLTALPAFAASTNFALTNSSTFERFAGGTGAGNSPYQITDLYGLQGLASPSNNLLTANAELINNISATGTSTWNSGAGFAPIGNNQNYYSGTFNGQDYAINGIYIDAPSANNVGLFGVASGTLENLILTGVQVTASSDVGGLVGSLGNGNSGQAGAGAISDVAVSGSVTGSGDYIGGLAGLNHGLSITASSTTGSVNGGGFVGGLVGSSLSPVTDSYSTASVTGGGVVGGLVGENYNGGVVGNSYSAGVVSGTSETGGLVGRNLNTIDNSFWDTTTSGITSSTGGAGSGSSSGATGATTAQLQTQSFILANSTASPTWDFTPATGTWGDNAVTGTMVGGVLTPVLLNGGLPYLQWQTPTPIELAASNQSVTYGNSIATDSSEYAVLPGSATLSSYATGPVSLTGLPTSTNVGTYSGAIGLTVTPDLGVTIERSLGTETITQAGLTVVTETGVSADNKVYDGTTAATLDLNSYTLSGVQNNDPITIDPVGYTATFATKNVGNSIAVTVTDLGLSGTNSGNYTLTQPTGLTADITPATLTVSGASANNKVYDTTTAATLTLASADLQGVVTGDVVAVAGGYTANFTTKDVGNNIPVTVSPLALTGADAGNYTLTQPTGFAANITPAPLTVTGAVAGNKVYDTTLADTLSNFGTLSGVLSGDTVTLDSVDTTATFTTKDVGNDKAVTVTGYTVGGAAAGNYTLTQPTGLTADITPASLTITGAAAGNKVYDGTLADTLSNVGTLSGVLGSDAVTVTTSGYTADFATKDAGNNKAVTVTGYTIGGTDAGNYTLSQPTGLTADITPATLTVSAAGVDNKVYDTTTTATLNVSGLQGVVIGDTVALATGYTANFATKDVGNDIAVTVKSADLDRRGCR